MGNRNAVSDKNVIPVQKPQKPVPRFPERIPAHLTVAAAPPSPPAAPPTSPSTPPPPPPSPAPIFIDVTSAPLLPQAVPAVPGRPIVSDQSISSLASSSSSLADKPVNTFIPMPVPAVPGI